jgi:hypothetical protein
VTVRPDLNVVEALCAGLAPDRSPTAAERVLAIRHLAGRMTDAEIAARVGRSPRTVQRLRREHGIVGLPHGTNRYTRP